MTPEQVVTIIISELNKDSRLRQMVQTIAVKASGGIVKTGGVHISDIPANLPVGDYILSPKPPISFPLGPNKALESLHKELNKMPTTLYPNGAMEHTDSQGNVVMTSGNVEEGKNWPIYPEMVRNLFKEGPPAEMLIHAAIGLAGETGELRAAVDRKEAIEEAGDITFYIEALRQRLPQNRGNMELLSEVVDSPYYKPNHATAVDNIHIISCQILDYCKKHWVYGKPLEEFTIAWHLELLEVQMNYYCVEMLGLTQEQVKYQNQAKLMKRYDAGKYSNEAAIARKDKQ